ncbi:hypothetical protein PUN28_004728 [Cardiocondyla obscurior]|uniref:Transmembrane protein n=1 Tax=Cardiocondyla obscurior TaxID=286306 RepID=A0AAW2GE53_9HYME
MPHSGPRAIKAARKSARVSLSERGSPRLVENTLTPSSLPPFCEGVQRGMRRRSERYVEREDRSTRSIYARTRRARRVYASKAARDDATARRGKGKQSDTEKRKPRRGWRRSVGRESDGRRKKAGLVRVRRVCKRRAARGGCTAPTFRGEAGDPIAMHHPVLYQQLPAIAAPMRPPSQLLFSAFVSLSPSFSLFLSLSLSLSFSPLFLFRPTRFVASAAARSSSSRSHSPFSRFSPFGSTFSSLPRPALSIFYLFRKRGHVPLDYSCPGFRSAQFDRRRRRSFLPPRDSP